MKAKYVEYIYTFIYIYVCIYILILFFFIGKLSIKFIIPFINLRFNFLVINFCSSLYTLDVNTLSDV